ncbi:MAG: hypothetical protein KDN19_05660 [Verrucomicrobiae bacterium]|nr:hypothetical protein [Verrucomicrobiae bacterium]
MMGGATTTVPREREIRAQLKRLLKSSRFRSSPRARDFLLYVTDETLRGRGDQLDQFSIGTNALGRKNNFCPSEDPAVRMQATRVRRALENFYLKEGTDDTVIISLPTGSYEPIFQYGKAIEESQSKPFGECSLPENWPTLLLTPFRNLTGADEFDFISAGVVNDLAVELDHYSGLRVFLNRSEEAHQERYTWRQTETPIEFELTGSFSNIGTELRFSIHLLRVVDGEQLWAEEFHFAHPESEMATIRNELPQRVAAAIAEEEGMISRHGGIQPAQSGKCCAGVYEAILLAYHAERHLSAETFSKAVKSLSRAVETHRECGLAWALLSRMWAIYFSHEMSGQPEGIEKAIECGREAVRLGSRDITARTALAYAFLLNDRIEDCRREIDHALEANPRTLFFMDTVGYLLTLSGDWERGPELSRQAIKRNPYPRLVAHGSLWLDAIRRSDYEDALINANQHNITGTFWTPLMRIVARVLAGDIKNAKVREDLDELLRYKPDFELVGRRLIGRYVKFSDLQDKIEKGLRGAGIVIRGPVNGRVTAEHC